MEKKPQTLILFLLVSFGSVGAVLFTPALPSIATYFGLSVGHAQLAITTYLVGYALGQLPYGPLANRFGRKTTLYIGISVAIIGSLLCAFSSFFMSFGLFLFARFLQALGSCVGLKVSYTMIADSYDQVDATRVLSRNNIAFAIIPGAAIAIGGGLTAWLNWESCFYFLALFGAYVLWLCTKLPETAKSLDPHALKPTSIVRGYLEQFKNRRLVISGLMMGCGAAIIYIFASKSPFIGINLIGLSPAVFGVCSLIPNIGLLLGSLISAKLAGQFPLITLLFLGTVTCLAMTFTMLIPFSIGYLNTWTLFLPMFLIYLAESLVFANASSFGLIHAQNKSNGSAVLNFINLSITVIAVLLIELIYPESAILLPISFLFFFGMMFWLCRRLKKFV